MQPKTSMWLYIVMIQFKGPWKSTRLEVNSESFCSMRSYHGKMGLTCMTKKE